MKEKAKKWMQALPAVYLALRDPETPFAAKLLAAVTVGYALSPVDLIPDFIPVLGYLDDVLILPGLIALTVRLIPPSVWERCLEQSAGLWRGGNPKKWFFAIPIVLIWLFLIFRILKAL